MIFSVYSTYWHLFLSGFFFSPHTAANQPHADRRYLRLLHSTNYKFVCVLCFVHYHLAVRIYLHNAHARKFCRFFSARNLILRPYMWKWNCKRRQYELKKYIHKMVTVYALCRSMRKETQIYQVLWYIQLIRRVLANWFFSFCFVFVVFFYFNCFSNHLNGCKSAKCYFFWIINRHWRTSRFDHRL